MNVGRMMVGLPGTLPKMARLRLDPPGAPAAACTLAAWPARQVPPAPPWPNPALLTGFVPAAMVIPFALRPSLPEPLTLPTAAQPPPVAQPPFRPAVGTSTDAAHANRYGGDPVPVGLRRLDAFLGAASAVSAAWYRPQLSYRLLRARVAVQSLNRNIVAPISDPARELEPKDVGRFIADAAGALAGYGGMAIQASFDRNASVLELPTTAEMATRGVERALAGYKAMRRAGLSDEDIATVAGSPE